PRGVHGAAGSFAEEDAVSVPVLEEGVPLPHPAQIPPAELLAGDTQVLRQAVDLFRSHPDIAGRASAALSAAGAPEAEAISVPRPPRSIHSHAKKAYPGGTGLQASGAGSGVTIGFKKSAGRPFR